MTLRQELEKLQNISPLESSYNDLKSALVESAKYLQDLSKLVRKADFKILTTKAKISIFSS